MFRIKRPWVRILEALDPFFYLMWQYKKGVFLSKLTVNFYLILARCIADFTSKYKTVPYRYFARYSHSAIQWCKYEPRHDKTNKMSVRPAKTQISLGIRPVWSESSLSAWRKLWSLATHWAHSEDPESSLGTHSFCWFCHVVAHL